MRKKLILSSKVILGLLCLMLAFFVILSFTNKSDVIIVPTWLFISTVITLILNLISITVLYVLELKAEHTEDKSLFAKRLRQDIFMLIMGFVVCLGFSQFTKSVVGTIVYFFTIALVTMAFHGCKYWKRA